MFEDLKFSDFIGTIFMSTKGSSVSIGFQNKANDAIKEYLSFKVSNSDRHRLAGKLSDILEDVKSALSNEQTYKEPLKELKDELAIRVAMLKGKIRPIHPTASPSKLVREMDNSLESIYRLWEIGEKDKVQIEVETLKYIKYRLSKFKLVDRESEAYEYLKDILNFQSDNGIEELCKLLRKAKKQTALETGITVVSDPAAEYTDGSNPIVDYLLEASKERPWITQQGEPADVWAMYWPEQFKECLQMTAGGENGKQEVYDGFNLARKVFAHRHPNQCKPNGAPTNKMLSSIVL